jgi:hypothetical protein
MFLFGQSYSVEVKDLVTVFLADVAFEYERKKGFVLFDDIFLYKLNTFAKKN